MSLAIESILTQTMNNFRLHIIDDCSHDDTWSLIEKFDDPRIRRIRNQHNHGLFANLNMLTSLATAPWIKLIGQDDQLLPNCLESGMTFANQHQDLGLFWCYAQYIDEHGAAYATPGEDHVSTVLDTSAADHDCLQWGCLSANIATLFLRREALLATGPFRTDIMSADFEMMSRIQAKYRVGRFTDVLVKVRSHSGQWSVDLRQMENHILGNMEVFERIFHRAVNERASLPRAEATRLLCRRIARNEFNWLLKAGWIYLDFGLLFRVGRSIGRVVPLLCVVSSWIELMAPRYLKRVKDLF